MNHLLDTDPKLKENDMIYRPLVRCTNCGIETTNQPEGDGCHACLAKKGVKTKDYEVRGRVVRPKIAYGRLRPNLSGCPRATGEITG
jgi:hypothetical protein